MGDETLLYPRLLNALVLGHGYLPSMSISLVSNGILLRNMVEWLWRAMETTDLELILCPTLWGLTVKRCSNMPRLMVRVPPSPTK